MEFYENEAKGSFPYPEDDFENALNISETGDIQRIVPIYMLQTSFYGGISSSA